MDISAWRREHRGPFRSHQLGDGDGYELTNGHPILCLPPTSFKGGLRLSVAQMLAADPAVEWAATGLGFSPDPMTLRAPDIMVWVRAQGPGATETPALSKLDRLRLSTALLLNTDPAVEWAGTASEMVAGPRTLVQGDSGKSSWITQPPPMAVELADDDCDESDLEQKIHELIGGGVRVLWVARLGGPRRVEVYVPGQSPRNVSIERSLTASGILSRPIPALALFSRDVALEQVLHRQLEPCREGDS